MKKFFYVFLSLCISTLCLKADFLEMERQKALNNKQLILLSIEKEGCSYCLKIKREPTFKNVVERLINDKHPLVYINSHIANYYIHDRKLENVKGSSLLRTSMTYRIAFSKKSMNERTFHRFDRKLLELEKKGVIKKILQKYGL